MRAVTELPANWVPCSLGRRLLIILYDGLVTLALLVLAAAIALPLTGAEQQAFRDVFYTLYLMGVWFAYLGWCWTRGGQTVGMRAWKARLQGRGGSLPGWVDASKRFLMALVSMLCLGAGFWLSLGHPERATWHDRVSGTRLVVRPAESDRSPQDQDHDDAQQ